MNTSSVQHYLDEHAACAATLPGAGLAWLDKLRGEALDGFTRLGFPTTRDEDWKYTRVSALEKRAFRAPTTPATTPLAESIALAGESLRMVFIDGRFSAADSDLDRLPAGLEFSELGAALAVESGDLAGRLGRIADPQRNGFCALNAAFMDSGAVLRVAAGTTIPIPLHLVFFAGSAHPDIAVHPRVVVHMERGSRATLVESYLGPSAENRLHNAVTEVTLDPLACLEHVKIRTGGAKDFHIGSLEVQQARGSELLSRLYSFGGALTRHDVIVRLAGEDARCTLDGLYVGGGRAHIDCHSRIEHLVPDCASQEDYRGILGGRARGVFDGLIRVHPDAQHSDARQRNTNLLLSADAEADTKPQLEIYADDVQCAHGATVGQLDEEMLFYLRSRGIAASAARVMLTLGFARDLIDHMSSEALRTRVTDDLLAHLPDAGRIKGMTA